MAPRIGLTGGIASGKSTVSARFAELGAVVVDADLLARQVVEPGTPGLAAVVAEFGQGVLAADGNLDRPALGALVFASTDRRRALEAIIHPLVHAAGAELEARAGEGTLVVHDIPLLAEGGRSSDFDAVVVVDVPEQTQVERMVRDRGMSQDEAAARMAAQATRTQRLAIADIVIENTGTLAELVARVDEVYAELMTRPGR